MAFLGEDKFFASSEGSVIRQEILCSDCTFEVTAVDSARGEFQSRNSLSLPVQRGYELVEEYPYLAEAEQAAEEAVQKLSAKPVEPGQYDLVLHPTHLWLTIHENCGHPTELDRALGYEANFAGTSFLTPDKLGKFRYGSKWVNMVADRTQPGALATVAYDDDGAPAQRWYIVREGVFVDYQTTREQAEWVPGVRPRACAHADSWASVVFQRMPNVSLDPLDSKLTQDDLIADVKKGILILGDGSYSIDQQRYNFQFGGQVFWEIENGKKSRLLRDVAYQGRTPEFWNACDGVAGAKEYLLGGTITDAKGEPGQMNAVSHGCPPARFRGINVINTGRART
jgi:TldD protein